jgi:hypothetical protein
MTHPKGSPFSPDYQSQLTKAMDRDRMLSDKAKKAAKAARESKLGWGTGTIPGLGLEDPAKSHLIKKPSQM